jgi:hypothetical protein
MINIEDVSKSRLKKSILIIIETSKGNQSIVL